MGRSEDRGWFWLLVSRRNLRTLEPSRLLSSHVGDEPAEQGFQAVNAVFDGDEIHEARTPQQIQREQAPRLLASLKGRGFPRSSQAGLALATSRFPFPRQNNTFRIEPAA